MENLRLNLREFKINEHITLKLIDRETVIYVNNERFIQCKYLLLSIPTASIEKFDDIDSIDDAKDLLNSELEYPEKSYIEIPPEAEFWAHCSNLQVWTEHDYDTRLLHSNLAFPLLRKLVDVGDEKAKKRFPQEIAERFASGNINVIKSLLVRSYLEYLSQEQRNTLLLDFFERDKIELLVTLLDFKALDLMSPELHEQIILHLFDIRPLLRHKKLNLSDHHLMKLYNRLSGEGKVQALKNVIDNEKLDLSNLNIYDIPNEILHFQLKELDLSHNWLREVPEWIGKCKSLQVLNLRSAKNIKMIPETIGELNRLKFLDLGYTKINEIPKSIGDLKNLEVLILNNNNLKEFPDSLNNLSNLRKLNLDENKLESLPDFSGLTSLKILYLDKNNISIFPESIFNLPNLERLSLSQNKLEVIPYDIGIFKKLKLLYLSHNNLQQIPESIGELKNLEILNLNSNNLTELPDSIENLKKLKELDLRWNNIKNIPKSLEGIPPI